MSCHGADRWARTARYSGCSKKPWRGGILAEPVGEAGHGVEPTPVDGERAHAMEGRGLPIDGASGRPGGAPGELVLADLVRGERGGPRGAAEEGGEMGDSAAGGAAGSELPHLVVLEVGVAEISQGRPLGAERARERRRRAGGTGGGCRAGLVRGHGLGPSLWWPRAGGVRPHSLWWARQARGMCGGERTAMCPVAYALMRGRHGATAGASRRTQQSHRRRVFTLSVGRPGDGSPATRRGGSFSKARRQPSVTSASRRTASHSPDAQCSTLSQLLTPPKPTGREQSARCYGPSCAAVHRA